MRGTRGNLWALGGSYGQQAAAGVAGSNLCFFSVGLLVSPPARGIGASPTLTQLEADLHPSLAERERAFLREARPGFTKISARRQTVVM